MLVKRRLVEIVVSVHPYNTKIVYCKNGRRTNRRWTVKASDTGGRDPIVPVRRVALVNDSPNIDSIAIQHLAEVLQTQVTRDLARTWNVSATVEVFDRPRVPPTFDVL